MRVATKYTILIQIKDLSSAHAFIHLSTGKERYSNQFIMTLLSTIWWWSTVCDGTEIDYTKNIAHTPHTHRKLIELKSRLMTL